MKHADAIRTPSPPLGARQHPDGGNVPALAVDGLSVDIHTPAGSAPVVRDVSFRVEAGRTLALLGESGCGKSMTAQAVAGVLDPVAEVTGGRVNLGGDDVLRLTPAQRRRLAGPDLAVVFQDALTALNPVFTVGWQLAEPFRIHRGLPRREARERAAALMERVGIPDARSRLNAYPHQFSGGMRQRLLIAMAVALQPTVLLADEPTTALDVTVQAQIMDLLAELRTEHRMALVLITHDLGVVADHADDVAVMYAGTVVEAGPTADVFARPHHPYTRGLLDSVPADGPRGGRLFSIEGSPPELGRLPSGCAFRARCPLATELCAAESPKLAESGRGRRVACHHAEEPSDD